MKRFSLLLLLVICLCFFGACENVNDPVNKEITQTQVKNDSNSLKTPYITLNFPQNFFDNIIFEVEKEEPYTVLFKTKQDNIELCSLVFNGKGDILVGTLIGETSNTVVYMNMPEMDSNSKNYLTYCGYQEDINKALNELFEFNDFVFNEIVEFEDKSTFDIKTSVATMKYPNKWKEKVEIKVTKEEVKFLNGETPLFDLVFHECEGLLLGTYNETPVYLVSHPVKTEEQESMQEDVNVILQNLMDDSNFTANS